MKDKVIIKQLIIFVVLSLAGHGCLYAQGLIKRPFSMNEKMEDLALDSAMRLPKTSAEVVIRVGDLFIYSARVHGSIGKNYKLEYDKEAFDVRFKTHYDNPGPDGKVKPGGDSGGKTSIFTTKKEGEYEIRVMKMDKTKVRQVITYKVTVISSTHS